MTSCYTLQHKQLKRYGNEAMKSSLSGRVRKNIFERLRSSRLSKKDNATADHGEERPE